ncbi:hypothetical protein SAMN05519105_1682 [Rhodobacter sp. 24-YEA-8]|nr:hypothetical protein SAMN05519105_1682 [Rhodobacter sp. 24-YEA-8]
MQFVMIEADRLDRMERKLDAPTEALRSSTVIPAPEWCPITEAAKRKGVSTTTIGRKIALGLIEARGNGKLKEVRI